MPAIKIEMLFEKYFFPKPSPFDNSICATQISLYCPFYARSGEPAAGGSGRIISPVRDRGVLHPHLTSRYRNKIHIFGRISLRYPIYFSVTDPDPSDPYVFGPPGSGSVSQMYGSGSFCHKAKIVLKNLDSYCFVTSF
jgi:hypothetical protein